MKATHLFNKVSFFLNETCLTILLIVLIVSYLLVCILFLFFFVLTPVLGDFSLF